MVRQTEFTVKELREKNKLQAKFISDMNKKQVYHKAKSPKESTSVMSEMMQTIKQQNQQITILREDIVTLQHTLSRYRGEPLPEVTMSDYEASKKKSEDQELDIEAYKL
jgi:hypothetical protein